eukprot:COSAG05_NODE_813_length_7167_cov_7.376627_5_plen_93_part_00
MLAIHRLPTVAEMLAPYPHRYFLQAVEASYTLREEQTALLASLERVETQCKELLKMCKLAYTPELLEAASLQLESTTQVLRLLSSAKLSYLA